MHDPADRNTAAGRFMEMMLLGAKAYEWEEAGEKVRTKLRMRAEKGLWNGGQVPYGFSCDASRMLQSGPKMAKLIPQFFQVYVDTRTDFVVRDWLKADTFRLPKAERCGRPA